MFPNVLTHPDGSLRKDVGRSFGSRCRVSPDIDFMIGDPSTYLPSIGFAVIMVGRLFSAWYQASYEVNHGQMTFRQVGGLCRPIIHLNVDVGVIVGIPWILQSFAPNSLQVGWK